MSDVKVWFIVIIQLVLQLSQISSVHLPTIYDTINLKIHKGSDNMKIEEFDTVLLKDGQTAAIVDKLSEDTFIADIGDSPEDWDTVTITIDEIEKVVYRNKKSIDR